MMTKQRIARLKRIIEDSRTRLIQTQPYYSILLMYLNFVADPKVKKMSTNGICIFFNPTFIEKLSWFEVDFILCHEVEHIIRGHIWRPTIVLGEDYHRACDIQANAHLFYEEFEQRNYSHLGFLSYVIPGKEDNRYSALDLSPLEIINLFPYSLSSFDSRVKSKYFADSDEKWDFKDDTGKGGILIINAYNDSREMIEISSDSQDNAKQNSQYIDSDNLKEIWLLRSLEAKRFLKKKEIKNAFEYSEFQERMLKKMTDPTLEWKRILNVFVSEDMNDYTFSPPDRRYSNDFFLPDYNTVDGKTKTILFMVDTSGSVTDNEIAKVYSEIQGAIEQYGGAINGKIGFFNTEVQEMRSFTNKEELINIIPVGGGGTDFYSVFKYVKEEMHFNLPENIVIFTDGQAEFPNESYAMGIPVLWIINNQEISPPWGKIARAIPQKQNF